MEMCVLRMAKSVKPHVPRIKFRKDSQNLKDKKGPADRQMKGKPTGKNSQTEYVTSLADIPSNFRREGPDEDQIWAINSGGAESRAPDKKKPKGPPKDQKELEAQQKILAKKKRVEVINSESDLPSKFKRERPDDKQIKAINSGGAD